MSGPSERPHHELDISTWGFWLQSFAERDRTFARLRQEDGPTWHQPVASRYRSTEQGIWALTRAEDIMHVSRDPEVFTATHGPGIDAPPDARFIESTHFFFAMDPPRHTLYRRLVSAAFTPRAVSRLQAQIEEASREIVDDLAGAGDVDFVAACAAKLPMRTICDLIGIPREDQERVTRVAEELMSSHDPEVLGDEDPAEFGARRVALLREAAVAVAADRRKNPRDDLMTAIVQAEVDGHRLTDDQIGAFMMLLTLAGTDTTKQSTCHAVLELDRHPDQRAFLLEDYDERIGPAIEEILRFASPILVMTRKATADTDIRGSRIGAGDRLALFYCSGNRDERVFDRPQEFDITRKPNPHIAFGGGGTHYCLGAQIAKVQLRSLLRELLVRLPDMKVGEPTMLPSHQSHAVKSLPVTV